MCFWKRHIVPKTPTFWIVVHFTMWVGSVCFKWTPSLLILCQDVMFFFPASLYPSFFLITLQSSHGSTVIGLWSNFREVSTSLHRTEVTQFSGSSLQKIWDSQGPSHWAASQPCIFIFHFETGSCKSLNCPSLAGTFNPPDSAFWLQQLQVWATTPCYFSHFLLRLQSVSNLLFLFFRGTVFWDRVSSYSSGWTWTHCSPT